ncbi:hypothetical protein KC19_1G212400 [Ceratodon purpureus]|uniref:Uncharacterized protein n=1 Tax=Ceratodon purpureus TaxID=3225 RepID=A0A8T0J8U4_CERPU|nr:hypothetical protein KC19_1G212400 [Ceratodon purpureus]
MHINPSLQRTSTRLPSISFFSPLPLPLPPIPKHNPSPSPKPKPTHRQRHGRQAGILQFARHTHRHTHSQASRRAALSLSLSLHCSYVTLSSVVAADRTLFREPSSSTAAGASYQGHLTTVIGAVQFDFLLNDLALVPFEDGRNN